MRWREASGVRSDTGTGADAAGASAAGTAAGASAAGTSDAGTWGAATSDTGAGTAAGTAPAAGAAGAGAVVVAKRGLGLGGGAPEGDVAGHSLGTCFSSSEGRGPGRTAPAAVQPRRARSCSMTCGTTLKMSPTTPKSAYSKISASSFLSIATMVFAVFMPARCWMAPEMPRAM